MSDPLIEVSLASGTALALETAKEALEPGRSLGSFEILAAAIATDPHGGWETIQLRTQFIDPDGGEAYQDPTIGPSGSWQETPLTPDVAAGLRVAADLARSHDLLPLPLGALVLGLVSQPQTGAARALLADSELSHAELLELLQDELLGARLESLDAAAASEPRAQETEETTIGRGLGPRLPPPGREALSTDDPAVQALAEGADWAWRSEGDVGSWLLSCGDRLLELYDLRRLNENERKRAFAEASVQLAFGEIDGLVPALDVRETTDWLILETPQLGEDMRRHLEAANSLLGTRWPAFFYVDQVAKVATALQRLHNRGLVHRRVEPANLVFDAREDRLMVSGFAVGVFEDDSRLSRYRAPESYAGEMGPSVDQYALGVTALDIFTGPSSPSLTKPLQEVLRRATAARAEDRFPDVDAFGKALQAAVRVEAPRTLAERLAALSPTKRAALAPAAIGVLCGAVLATAVAPGSSETPELILLTTLLALALMGGIVFALVSLAGALRGKRRRLSLRLASNPLVKFAIFALLVISSPHALDDSDTFGTVFDSLLISYGGCALLAPARPTAGAWLELPLILWGRRRLWPGRLRRGISFALLVAAVGLVAAPSLAKVAFDDFEFPVEKASEFGPLAPVWNLRNSLAADKTGFVCRDVMTIAAARDKPLCRKVAHTAATVQAADPIAKTHLDFGVKGRLEAFGIQELPSVRNHRLWLLLTPDHKEAGAIYTTGPHERELVAMLSRTPPRPSAEEAMRSTWLYEIVWNGKEWRIAEYRACEIGAPGTGKKPADCVIASTVSATELEAALADRHRSVH